jgi:hypothetical protein
MRNAYQILTGIPKARGQDYSESVDVDRRILLKWISWKLCEGCRLHVNGDRAGENTVMKFLVP